MNKSKILLRKPFESKNCQLRWLKTSQKQTPSQYCFELVRKHDHDSFLCTLLLPSNLRSSAFAIKAFNTEIALVQDQVRDNNIGLLRMKFWENTLNDIYNDKPPQNPTALELHRVLQEKKLSKHYFKRLIEARFDKLQSPTFMDLKSVEKYAEYTVSSIYYLLLEAYDIKDINTDHFASHVGKAHGLVTLIRSVPYNARQRNLVLPQDILMKHNVSSESIFQELKNPKLNDVIFEIATRAKQHLDKAKSMKKQIRKESSIIFLPSHIIDDYLEKLQRVNFDILHPKLRKNGLLPLKLYWKKLFA